MYEVPNDSPGAGVAVTVALPFAIERPLRPLQVAKSSDESCSDPVHAPGVACVVMDAGVVAAEKVTEIELVSGTPEAPDAGDVLTTVSGAQTPAVHVPLRQSALTKHVSPLLQCGQAVPPQSVAVSSWFLTASVHDAVAQVPALQTPLVQSEPERHWTHMPLPLQNAPPACVHAVPDCRFG